MVILPEFQKALDEKDILQIRIILKNFLGENVSFSEFDELIKLAENTFPNFYDVHDGEILKHDSSKWDKEYINRQKVKLVDNFSRERLELLKKICTHLYGAKETKPEPKPGPEPGPGSAPTGTREKNRKFGKQLVFGGATFIGAGILTEVTLITVIGAAAVVGGGIIIVNNRER